MEGSVMRNYYEESAMRRNNAGLGYAETGLILQAKIEAMTPAQLLLRDELVHGGLSSELATEFIKTFSELYTESSAEMEIRLRKNGANEGEIMILMDFFSQCLAGSILGQLVCLAAKEK